MPAQAMAHRGSHGSKGSLYKGKGLDEKKSSPGEENGDKSGNYRQASPVGAKKKVEQDSKEFPSAHWKVRLLCIDSASILPIAPTVSASRITGLGARRVGTVEVTSKLRSVCRDGFDHSSFSLRVLYFIFLHFLKFISGSSKGDPRD